MTFDLVWFVLFILALLALIASAASLGQGVRLRGHVHRAMRMAFGAFLPSVVVILPVRGLDVGFDANVRAILSQSYPAYRVLVVADDPTDPAAVRALSLAREFPAVSVSVTSSDPSHLPGKVNALRSALGGLAPTDRVLVFVDSDIRPAADWLRQLVQPLADSTVGVATGFRWYAPPRPTFWSLVRAEWNGVSANVLFDPRRAFAWGGSCAIRRDLVSSLRLEERWREVLSDDLVLSQAVRDSGLSIAYAPAALVATVEDADRSECVEWCLRQMTMATLYLPIVRTYAAAAFAVFDGSVVLGVICLGLATLWGPAYILLAALFFVPIPATIAKAALRRRAFFAAAPAVSRAWKVPAWRTALASAAVPWLMAWGLVRTRRPTSVRWRGRVYDVRDPNHVRLLEPG